MSNNFSNRVDRKTQLDEAKRRFVVRVSEEIFTDLFSASLPTFKRVFATVLGKRYTSAMASLEEYIDPGFEGTLQGLEAFYTAYSMRFPSDVEGLEALSSQIHALLKESEVDLGVRWDSGQFILTDPTCLDESLINDVLGWLQEKQAPNVLAPYRRGLMHFLNGEKYPEMLADIVIDMYTSFEALVKNITYADLSTSQELFINKIKVSEHYKNVLREYIKYAHTCRQAVQLGKIPLALSIHEVESFIYLTGVFIRLALTTVSSSR